MAQALTVVKPVPAEWVLFVLTSLVPLILGQIALPLKRVEQFGFALMLENRDE